jgi:leucyl-tRNA synthetase
MPVDWYNGGMEHTTLHLLYSRFWHKFLYDIGQVAMPEPYAKRTSHGMILGETNEKMSKSRGNVVNPDDIVGEFGADTLRTYEMFIGAFELAAAWSNEGVKGCRRFLDRVWRLQDMLKGGGYSDELKTAMHKTIKKVTADYENMKFNTALAAMMALTNEFYRLERVTKAEFETLLILLNPVAPHITEELFEKLGNKKRIYQSKWPEYDENLTVTETVTIGVTVNGKVKASVDVSPDERQDDVRVRVFEIPAVIKAVEGKEVVKEIYVSGRIYNIAVR